GRDVPSLVGVELGPPSGQEERGRHALGGERREDRRDPSIVRPGIEGQRDHLLRGGEDGPFIADQRRGQSIRLTGRCIGGRRGRNEGRLWRGTVGRARRRRRLRRWTRIGGRQTRRA